MKEKDITIIVNAVLAALDARNVPEVKPEVKAIKAKPAKSSKQVKAKLVKNVDTMSDAQAFDLVKRYVMARKAGKVNNGPFLTCYRHISADTTLSDVVNASPTALHTLKMEAQKVASFKF